MNTKTNTIRELTTAELDAVGGGFGISLGGSVGASLGGVSLGGLAKLGSQLFGDASAFAKSISSAVGGFLKGLSGSVSGSGSISF